MDRSESLTRKILSADPAFMWVMALNKEGEMLCHVYSDKYVSSVQLRKETQTRLAALDTIFYQAFSQAEEWYGKVDFFLLAFGKAKVMLLRDRIHGFYFVARIPRSSMGEYLYPKIEQALKD